VLCTSSMSKHLLSNHKLYWIYFFDNGERKCKCFVEHTWDNVVSFKPYLVTPTWSNTKKTLSVRPCAWGILHVIVNFVANSCGNMKKVVA